MPILENQEYANVIEQCDTYITQFEGEKIVPKFEFLKAVAKARLYGFESYNESINYIALNYPNSPEGKKAEDMMENVMPLLSKNEFQSNDVSKQFKAIYQFTNAQDEEIEEFINKLNEAITKIDYFELRKYYLYSGSWFKKYSSCKWIWRVFKGEKAKYQSGTFWYFISKLSNSSNT